MLEDFKCEKLKNLLNKQGYIQVRIPLSKRVERLVVSKSWKLLDETISKELSVGGVLHRTLSSFISIKKTEHIIAIRNGHEDEDGIWHDDGSRELAFTLSLTLNPIEGGVLYFRKKNSLIDIHKIPTPGYGTITIFKTGVDGFEHKITKVLSGVRVIIAGWIN